MPHPHPACTATLEHMSGPWDLPTHPLEGRLLLGRRWRGGGAGLGAGLRRGRAGVILAGCRRVVAIRRGVSRHSGVSVLALAAAGAVCPRGQGLGAAAGLVDRERRLSCSGGLVCRAGRSTHLLCRSRGRRFPCPWRPAGCCRRRCRWPGRWSQSGLDRSRWSWLQPWRGAPPGPPAPAARAAAAAWWAGRGFAGAAAAPAAAGGHKKRGLGRSAAQWHRCRITAAAAVWAVLPAGWLRAAGLLFGAC